MPINFNFTIRDEDVLRFRAMATEIKEAMDRKDDEEAVQRMLDSAAALLAEVREEDLPQFIAERVLKMETLLNMVRDKDWQLGDDERKAILGALAYFADSDDLISDRVPGLGFLDDAIYMELILEELAEQIHTYTEFCQFRIAEENRRRNRGLDPHVDRQDWLADKRAALHSRMRDRRGGETGSPRGWYLGLFSS